MVVEVIAKVEYFEECQDLRHQDRPRGGYMEWDYSTGVTITIPIPIPIFDFNLLQVPLCRQNLPSLLSVNIRSPPRLALAAEHSYEVEPRI